PRPAARRGPARARCRHPPSAAWPARARASSCRLRWGRAGRGPGHGGRSGPSHRARAPRQNASPRRLPRSPVRRSSPVPPGWGATAPVGEVLLTQLRQALLPPRIDRVELLQPRAARRGLIAERFEAQAQHAARSAELIFAPQVLVPLLRARDEAV